MLESLALMVLCSILLSSLMQKLKLPGLIGMLLTGIILGPYVLNLIAPQILTISTDLRQIALIIILTRAGLALDISDLKKVGRPAFLMCFLPASFEIIATTLLAPMFFEMSYLEAAILGTVIGAVSPAVVVPKMLHLMEKGYGRKAGIPQLIMASASVDDIYVIVLFTSFLGMYQGEAFNVTSLIKIPVSILLGVLLGCLVGKGCVAFFKRNHLRDTVKILVIISLAFLFVTLENRMVAYVPISGLISVMAMGATIYQDYSILANRLSHKFSKIWVAAELILFILVGATVDLNYLANAGILALVLIGLVLSARFIGVFVALLHTPLSIKERLFCAIAYLPKATVQAAIGGIPLAAGVEAGNTILTISVLAIILTAPLGALGIDLTYQKILNTSNE
ncbi:sodium:proton antiporter [Aerococcaceae bacterium DSM 109653]|uniref:Sodium:proton antiporter n=1 Tax=Fundicoccus ignavus TaxID=2664442 RepID=A0A844BRR4_9LACT|nr:cation:proton antiporter [Fundicoccus ignavus]MRI80653.1 sodium:proton antiporter [Fundicoccus ignavus]